MDIIINKQGLLRWFIFLLWTTGLTDGSDVIQTSILWENKGVNATMSCSHTKGVQYFQMYWYRQLPGVSLEQVVYTSLSRTKNRWFGNFSGEKYSATKPDTRSGTFTVKNVQPEDEGLYFCAVSEHSDTDALNS
ncbi:hypothetical protein VZT92_009046 [Zoarces viviparus]|uniref:Ig-like domain-containing protein n=1 Tax=Zoarces viviparus TaxID=48416 RepID=A0AAW1FH26_ZOAVI